MVYMIHFTGSTGESQLSHMNNKLLAFRLQRLILTKICNRLTFVRGREPSALDTNRTFSTLHRSRRETGR